MITHQKESTTKKNFQTILISTLLVAVLDILAASIVFNLWFKMTPIQVFQFIASSVYGQEAFDGSISKILAGMVIHLITSFIIAAVYFYGYPKIRLLSKSPIASGCIYGFGFWVIMNLLIIPNTHIAPSPFNIGLALTSIAWHMILVGLPAAIITAKHYKKYDE